MPLNGKAARSLRALAHELKPVVMVGKHGATDDVAAAVARALLDHELIKVKVLGEAPESPDDIGATLAEATGSDVAQRIGRIVVLYKPHPKKPKIKVPAGYTPPAKKKPTPPKKKAKAEAEVELPPEESEDAEESEEDTSDDE